MLPRIISGASVGSIIAAIVGTRPESSLEDIFSPGKLTLNFFPSNRGSAKRKLVRFLKEGVLMDINILKGCVRENVPDLTFQEAFDVSGRIINIVISPTTSMRENSRLLNYLTAPNVLVWSAALASCAIPGIYAPVELMSKDEDGNIVPYFQRGVKWADGSLYADLPTKRLAELFNVNHFIVSQTNPHVVPFLTHASSNKVMRLLTRTMHWLRKEIADFVLNVS